MRNAICTLRKFPHCVEHNYMNTAVIKNRRRKERALKCSLDLTEVGATGTQNGHHILQEGKEEREGEERGGGGEGGGKERKRQRSEEEGGR